ncbi:MAG: hypothetical protein Kow0059_15340 [Candidatus Sumerlaeia bacterium]
MATYYFISDLHLGAGDEREDFYWSDGAAPPASIEARRCAMAALHDRFGAFVDWMLAASARRGEPARLIILGDFLDLLQVLPEAPQSPGKIARIAAAHGPVFDHLRRFHAGGGTLDVVIGNHDHELFAPALWKALQRELPFINSTEAGGGPTGWFAAADVPLYAEHGSQFDPPNAFESFGDPAQTNLGCEIVRHIVNPTEERFPLLDNLSGTRATLWFALRNMPALLGAGLRRQWRDLIRSLQSSGRDDAALPLGEVFLHLGYLLLLHYAGASTQQLLVAVARMLMDNEDLLRAARRGAGEAIPRPGLLASLAHLGRHPGRILTGATEDDVRRGAEALLRAARSGVVNPAPQASGENSGPPPALGPVPTGCRMVLCGHTHRAEVRSLGEGWVVNTGCWRPVARPFHRARYRIEQPLDVIVVARDREGAWRPRHLSFAARLRRQ